MLSEDHAMRTAQKLFGFAVIMFCFGVFAMPPLYDVLCDLTGVNADIEQTSVLVATSDSVDTERLVTIEFDTNINTALPWKFKAMANKSKVHPGELAEMIFVAENKTDQTVFGQAIPSIAPASASAFFSKTECFCFTRQVLAANERKEMVVRFVVDSKLPKDIKTITLSYTFFRSPDSDVESVTNNKPIAVINHKS